MRGGFRQGKGSQRRSRELRAATKPDSIGRFATTARCAPLNFAQVALLAIPIVLAVTFHEAAHGYVALFFGDDTAKQAGRLTLNPLKHVDPFGTIILPLLLIVSHAGFLFGYAKI